MIDALLVVFQTEDSDFESEDPDYWHVFKVSQQRGRRQGHYFFKFAALPQGTYGYGKRGCANTGKGGSPYSGGFPHNPHI